MKSQGALLVLVAALALAGCGEREPAAPEQGNTSVLGGSAPDAGRAAAGTSLADGHGQPIPPPPAPAGAQAQVVRTGDSAALAVWAQDGRVHASSHAGGSGWSDAQPLEEIHGQASDPQLAGNGQGSALAVWRHTVGSIQSLRFSHYEPGSGWSRPDVVPGALPRPDAPGGGDSDAPMLQMDAAGRVTARWPSGFDPAEMQVAQYTPRQGWSRAVGERIAASPEAPAASATP